jgi:hypothetical protein
LLGLQPGTVNAFLRALGFPAHAGFSCARGVFLPASERLGDFQAMITLAAWGCGADGMRFS